jgi:hypothetical protein
MTHLYIYIGEPTSGTYSKYKLMDDYKKHRIDRLLRVFGSQGPSWEVDAPGREAEFLWGTAALGLCMFFLFFFKWLFFILPHFKDLAPSKSWFSDISHFVNKTLVSSYKHSDGTCAPVFRWGLVTAGLWKNPFYKPYKPASRMGFYQWKGHWSSEIVNSSQNLRPSRCWSFQ